jgi:tetratricopeptide (TPR) repeat protein
VRKLILVFLLISLLGAGLAPAQESQASVAKAQASAAFSEAIQLNAQIATAYKAGKFDEALLLALRALELINRAPDANFSDRNAARLNLAEIYIAQKNYAQALRLYEEVLALYEKSGPHDNSRQILALERTTAIYLALKDNKRAEESATQVLALREKAVGPDSPQLLDALNVLGEIQFKQKHYGAAMRWFARAQQINEKTNGTDNALNAHLLEMMARALDLDGENPKKVEEIYLRALALKEKLLGENHLQVKYMLLHVAKFYFYENANQKAEELFLRALAIEDKLPEEVEAGNSVSALTLYRCFLRRTNQQGKLTAFDVQRAFVKRPQPADKEDALILNGRAVKLAKPVYPRAVRLPRTVTISIRVTIDETGKVINAFDPCGMSALLAEAAIEAAYKSSFTPTLVNGKPVKVTGIINYNFVSR